MENNPQDSLAALVFVVLICVGIVGLIVLNTWGAAVREDLPPVQKVADYGMHGCGTTVLLVLVALLFGLLFLGEATMIEIVKEVAP